MSQPFAYCKTVFQPKELAEITKQTAPQLSQFFLKIANDQVVRMTSVSDATYFTYDVHVMQDQKSLKKDFFEGEPISPLKYLVHNQYLTYVSSDVIQA